MKLIVCDFDGTYFTNEENIKKNNKLINYFRKNNYLFMLSSGRSFKSLKDMTKKYHIKYDYLSCCDGSILYDNKDKIIIKYYLDSKIINQFLKLKTFATIEKIQYSYEDDYYSQLKDEELIGLNYVIKNENISKKFLKEYNYLKKNNPNFDFLIYEHNNITYFCLKNRDINKSSTIDYLKQLLDIDYKNIFVLGDNDNDYVMLLKYNSYYIGDVKNKIKKVCIKGYNEVYEFLNELKKEKNE